MLRFLIRSFKKQSKMKQLFYFLASFLTGLNAFGQSNYAGFVDKYPIELFLPHISSEGGVQTVYTYTNYDDPIVIKGKVNNGTLTLFEQNSKGQNTASLTFAHFDPKSTALEGIWEDLTTQKQLKITLKKEFELTEGNGIAWQNREILQAVSIDNKYFKLIVSKSKDYYYPQVTGIKILEKKTDKLIQEFKGLECELRRFSSVDLGDFNFDGIVDFSIFEAHYAGPNTSHLYFLYDSKTKKYFNSGFTGVSLQFDAKTKRIHEHNQWRGGEGHTTAVYKIVHNKMVLLEEHCYLWDEKKQKVLELKMKDCK